MAFFGGIINYRQTPIAGAGTTAQRPTLNVPGTAWINLDDPANPYWERYNGSTWVQFSASAPTLPAWSLAGNVLTGTEKLGSTNDQDVDVYRNNVFHSAFEDGRLYSANDIETLDGKNIRAGNIGIISSTAIKVIGANTGNQRIRFQGSGTEGSIVDCGANMILLARTEFHINVHVTLQLLRASTDTGTGVTTLQWGRINNDSSTKSVVYTVQAATGAGNVSPDLYFVGVRNNAAGHESNVYMCHNGTAAVGKMCIGGNAPSASSFVQIDSTTGCFKPPRMTTTQRDAIAAEAGDTIYNTTTNKHQGYDGSTWNDFY